MEAKSADALPTGRFQFEPKWDGFRALAFKDGSDVELRGKSGKSLSRYFPEMIAALATLKAKHFVVDGELVIPVGSILSFDALQMRLHPAESRIRKLARETPALYILFDILGTPDGHDVMNEPLQTRRSALEAFFKAIPKSAPFRLTPMTRRRADAQAWLKRSGGALDGVVAKALDAPYTPGERRMIKVKCLRTADCVVGGFRYQTGSRDVGSLLLGLYNEDGKLDHVGFTSAIGDAERPALTEKLEKLRGGVGFSGSAPGGPSRWSTERSGEWEPLKPKLVAEVQYDHVSGGRFRHGTGFLRWRPDKPPKSCTFDQLELEARPSKLMRTVLGK